MSSTGVVRLPLVNVPPRSLLEQKPRTWCGYASCIPFEHVIQGSPPLRKVASKLFVVRSHTSCPGAMLSTPPTALERRAELTSFFEPSTCPAIIRPTTYRSACIHHYNRCDDNHNAPSLPLQPVPTKTYRARVSLSKPRTAPSTGSTKLLPCSPPGIRGKLTMSMC